MELRKVTAQGPILPTPTLAKKCGFKTLNTDCSQGEVHLA